MHSTSLPVRWAILASTNTAPSVPSTSSSVGAETQQTQSYQSPAEEICCGPTGINLCHLLSPPPHWINSISSMQLSQSLSNATTSSDMMGCATCRAREYLCLTSPFLSCLIYWLYFSLFVFIQRQHYPVAAGWWGVLAAQNLCNTADFMDQHLQLFWFKPLSSVHLIYGSYS